MESAAPPQEQTWNTGDLFADDAAFERAKQAFLDLLPSLQQHAGHLSDSASLLADALDVVAGATKSLGLLHCYASLRSDRDTRVAAHQATLQEVELLGTELSRRTAFLRPEILTIPPERIELFLREEPRLALHAHSLRDLLRLRQHVLGPAEERIVAEASLLTRGATTLYQVLTQVELPRRKVTLAGGETIELNPVTFQKHRSSQHREDRLAIFPAYFAAYADFEDTLGQNLYGACKSHMFHARVRGFPSSLGGALAADNVPESVYRRLIEQAHEHLGVLHRYLKLRARALGLPRLSYADLYCPLIDRPPRQYPVAHAQELVLAGLAPLGDAYRDDLRAAFASRWIDWHPAPGKRSGAYATGWAYDYHPFVLLNFNGNYESVLTLAHEMGHALHSHYSNLTQPYPTADYSIFVAEVASTFNETLLLESMLSAAATREERISLAASWLDGFRGTVFRQVMFAEFELAIHEKAERGEALTGEALSAMYLALLRRYHGHDEGVTEVDECYAIEWAAIPHLYYNFYVYQYATGLVAATALARAVLEDRTAARQRYLEFLRAGGSDYPLALLARAGVDLQASEPYRETFATAERYLDRLETWLAPPADRR